jgi:adenine/guanine phosphoribosyltransferase-like PRPP-binding protein
MTAAASIGAELAQLVTIDASEARRAQLLDILGRTNTVLAGHFSQYRNRHSTSALRFRGIGRDPAALDTVCDALLETAPAPFAARLRGAKILSPESSGYFLGRALATRASAAHAVTQTDLRRMPSPKLLAGAIEPNERVVLVNDIASSGASLDILRELVVARGAIAVAVVLFAVVGTDTVRDYCAKWQLPVHWLVTARWGSYEPGACPGCRDQLPLAPVAEFA